MDFLCQLMVALDLWILCTEILLFLRQLIFVHICSFSKIHFNIIILFLLNYLSLFIRMKVKPVHISYCCLTVMFSLKNTCHVLFAY